MAHTRELRDGVRVLVDAARLVRFALLHVVFIALAACGGAQRSRTTAVASNPGGSAQGVSASQVDPTASAMAGPRTEAAALSRLSAQARKTLETAVVPMFVLPEPYASGTSVMAGEHWTSLEYRDETLSIRLQAGEVAHQEMPPEVFIGKATAGPVIRGRQAYLAGGEGIRGLSWEDGGVGYGLEVECADAEQDPRCIEDAFIVDVAQRLVAVPWRRPVETRVSGAPPEPAAAASPRSPPSPPGK